MDSRDGVVGGIYPGRLSREGSWREIESGAIKVEAIKVEVSMGLSRGGGWWDIAGRDAMEAAVPTVAGPRRREEG